MDNDVALQQMQKNFTASIIICKTFRQITQTVSSQTSSNTLQDKKKSYASK